MHRHIISLFILLQMWLPCSLAGQKSDYRLFDNISLGAEASVISCFLQDTQGLIWIGSNKGLFSYDGYSSQPHFTFGERNNTRIYCGEVVDSTYLYLGADNGLLIYNYRTDTYEEPKADFPTDIRTLALHDGILWLGTLNGLYTYSPETRRLSAITEGLPHQTIYSLIHASDGNLYIGTYNGCCRYIPATGRFETINLPVTGGRSNQFVNSLLEDATRRCIWIGTEGCLFKYTLADGRMQRIDVFHDNSVKSLALDGNGRLMVGTDNGLYVYQEDESLLHVVHDSRNLQSLSNNIIWAIFADREHNVWLGTDYGISMSRHNSALRHIPISQITGTGEGNQFYSMLRDTHGTYWFGGTNGLIRFTALMDGEQDVAWYKMGDRKYPLSHNRVRHLYEDREQQLWVATDGSISRYDPTKRQFIHYNIVDSTRRYNANWAYGLFEDRDGQLWIATCLGGIFVVDKENLMRSSGGLYMAEKTYSIHDGLFGMFINQMIPDREGNVWALLYNSPNSIEKINPRTGEVTHIAVGELKGDRTPNFILCAEDGYIWIGFPGGVMRVTPENDSIRMLPFDAYNHYEVLSMAEADGRIWISTTDGFWVADQQTLEVRRLNITDKRFTSMFFDKTSGEFYLGTADGFAISSPEALLAEHLEQPLILTALYVNNQLYQPGIRYSHRINLDYDQNNLVFELSDLPYSLEEKSKLLYRLEGVDREWNLLKPNTNRIIYNNLNYGDYRLIVSKLDAHGKPSEKTYALDIHIIPPWYYTPWAKAVYVLLCLVLILWTINFFRVKNRLKLERLEKEKILEQSQAKMEFFTNLSHDLKTPLSMIIAPISRMLPAIKNPQEKKQLEQVQHNAMKLNSLIHQGLDFNRVDSGNNALLILSQIELVSFVRGLLTLYAEEKTREKQLTFDFHTDREKIYIQMDAIKLESILDNLLSNAVKYTPEGGSVTLRLEIPDEGKEVHISVSDTGIGVPRQDQPYIFQRFFQSPKTAGKKEGTGIGLYLVKTYTELHGGSVLLTSEENKGTTVMLNLPVVSPEQMSVDALSSDAETVSPEAPLILIVDDTQEIAEFIYQILHVKYRCRIAENGKTGMEMAMELSPDLIIADVMMPVMGGLEMVRCLKKHIPTSTIPIILLTAKSDKETELESIQLNIEAFIPKPFEPDILLSRVQQLLAAREMHETKARIEALAAPKEIEAVSYDEKFLANIIHLIEEHISDSELNVNALCEWTSTNNKQMYRKIKQLTGMTPVEYIKSIRMKKAAMLLKQQKFTVAEVMYMVGFSNHSYFSKCFQAEFGVTPKQYI
ncbi:hybrid sensor histidine kinase/response regulator transcription factor [Bacteroides oleiciplenus]|uniref:hybrid sensor histidine kinase/response regulator transcription factor n=1 Tax=Bacteroides oleiciplenus TaxID=626931 RepID=UPI0026DC5A57|nr:two-component regulator propeller domain-containing protein [Bacteroides oleiciplenus]